jgi:hypothetical protein
MGSDACVNHKLLWMQTQGASARIEESLLSFPAKGKQNAYAETSIARTRLAAKFVFADEHLADSRRARALLE